MNDYLKHYGILGMKWGIRRFQNKDGTLTPAGKKRYQNKVGERSKEGPKDIDKRKVLLSAKTKNGAEITLSEDPPSPIAKLLKKITAKSSDDKQYDLTIRDSSGKKVGDFSMINVSDEEINFAWIGIKSSQRGKGYAQASIKAAIDFAKKEGKKVITFEDVATPDGKHIYDKLGFKEVPMNSPLSKFSKMSASELEDYKMFWGEPRPMVMYLDDNIKHSSSPLDMSSFFNLVMKYMDFVDEEGRFMESLTHYGILGMKWGVRRFQNKDGTLTAAGKKRYRNKDGTLTEKGKKKDEKEANKEIAKRSTKIWVEGNNYAAKRINGKWLEDFNNKWKKVFEGYDDWRNSPEYSKYEKEYFKNLSKLMNESIKNNPESKFTTKLGSTYIARYIEEYGNIQWATEKEWSEYDKKK